MTAASSRLLTALSRLRPTAKAAIVAGGYGLALVIAGVAVRLSITATSQVDRQASSGMTAFGDALFFLAVFAVAAIPPTAAALFFLVTWWRARR